MKRVLLTVISLLLLFCLWYPGTVYAGIVINEIHYNPPGTEENEEFIELWNPEDTIVDISSWYCSNGFSYAFPEQTVVSPHGYVIIARNPKAFLSTYPGVRNVFGPFSQESRLNNSGDRIILADAEGNTVFSVRYDDAFPWPDNADGNGKTLELRHPRLNPALPDSWAASIPDGGTPGTLNSRFDPAAVLAQLTRSPLSPGSTSLVHIACDITGGDAVMAKVYYTTESGWDIADLLPATGSVRHCTLPARPEGTRVDYYTVFTTTNGSSYFYPYPAYAGYTVTDAPFLSESLVINEIMYHSALTLSSDSYEYVELLNNSTTTVDAAGFIFESIQLPLSPLLIPPGGFLVLTDNPTALLNVYGAVTPVFECDIALDDEGETLHLYDQNGRELHRIKYGIDGEWPSTPNGSGHSLELRNPYMDPDDPASWQPSAGTGTPGKTNSVFTPGAFGHFTDLVLDPPNPTANQPVHLSARIIAPIPPTSAEVIIKGSDGQTTSHQLYDDGLHADGDANDGLYGADLPGVPELTYVYYYLQARLNGSTDVLYPPPENADPVEMVVRLSGGGLRADVIPTHQWQVVTINGYATSSELYAYLQSPGAALIDDIRISYNGSEFIPNGTFDVDDYGWNKRGNHSQSQYVPTLGYSTPGCERIVATANGSSEANSVNRMTTPNLNQNSTSYTLTFACRLPYERWLYYHTGTHTYSNIFINELMAANSSTPINNRTEYEDWIELFNANSYSVPVGGMYLSDNPLNPDKWRLPGGTVIPPNGFLVIYADGLNQGLHASFKLSEDGEALLLSAPDGTIVDSIDFGRQYRDVSLGRGSDGAQEWSLFSSPTPGAPNVLDEYSGPDRTPAPVTSHPGGMYTGTQLVELSVASPYARIFYTRDGSPPGTNTLEYSALLTVDATTVIRAQSYEPGYLPSTPVTWTLLIDESSPLPIVSMAADPDALWNPDYGIYINEIKDVEIPMSVAMYEPDGSEAFNLDGGAQIFGLNIFRFAQKPFSIYTRGKYGSGPVEYQIFPDKYINVFKSFVVRNGGDDWPDAHFRDGLCQKIMDGRLSISRQAYRPCLGFLNGQFWGIYNLREKVNEHYLAAHFGVDPAVADFLESDLGVDMQVIQGSPDHYTDMLDYIEGHDMSVSSNYAHVKTLMNIDNFIELIIAEVYTDNSSWFHNRKWWRPHSATGRWEWILFDMERGIHDPTRQRLDDIYTSYDLFRMLCTSPEFMADFIQSFAAHLSSTFKPERIINCIDSMHAALSNDMPRHVDRWKSEGGIPSMAYWYSEINQMRSFAEMRPGYVFGHIKEQFSLAGTYSLLLDAAPPEAGLIYAQRVSFPEYPASATFFLDYPLILSAEAKPGYHFVQWKEFTSQSETLVSPGSVWRYDDSGADLGTSWFHSSYNDSSWPSGNAQLGYGDGDEVTVLNYGPDANNKYITYYFRTVFMANDPGSIIDLQLELLRDDGAVVFLNGHELLRSNMPDTPVDYLTPAANTVSGSSEDAFSLFPIDPALLIPGTNLLAVEVHQADATSSDLSFDLALHGTYLTDSTGTVLSVKPVITGVFDSSGIIVAEFEPEGLNLLPERITTQTVLRTSHDTYYASGSITVNSNATLLIEPGVDIRMPQGASLYVYGELRINGTPDAPVIISAGSNTWGSLVLLNTAKPAVVSNLVILGATSAENTLRDKAAISCFNSDVSLYNVVITNSPFPIFAQYGRITLRNSTLHSDQVCDLINVKYAEYARVENCNLYGAFAPDTDGIDFDDIANGSIVSNYIHDFHGSNNDAIDLGEGSPLVRVAWNRIMRCNDKGISIGQGSRAEILHNVIAFCSKGFGIKDSGSYALAYNNTLYGNTVGIACYEKNAGAGGGSADVYNTIIAASPAASQYVDSLSSLSTSYCLSDYDLLPGSPNILADPLLSDPDSGDFSIPKDSPCVNAGDPDFPADPDGTTPDIGAYHYQIPEPSALCIFLLIGIFSLFRKNLNYE